MISEKKDSTSGFGNEEKENYMKMIKIGEDRRLINHQTSI